MAGVVALTIFLIFYNLTNYPAIWFDEGSHLHVPKTLVRFGVYADYSSEGFRHYGPTIGVGPTVMLPIAAAFKLFGIGLLQARLIMALYLLATIYAFFRLGQLLGGQRLALVASALLISSQAVSLVEYGRQVLGEVPGFFFILVGLTLWFSNWEKSSWQRLIIVGLLLGLAMVTKHQYLLLLVPSLGLAWLANLVYYRTAPQRIFILPGVIAVVCFLLWQAYLVVYLGPNTATENLAMLREFTAGAALVLSPDLMKQALKEMLSFKVYFSWLLPGLIYSFFLALPRRREEQQWGLLLIMSAINLSWYVVASIGWLRYAFPGLAIASLLVARFFYDLTNGFKVETTFLAALRRNDFVPKQAFQWVMLLWLAAMIGLPLAQTTKNVVWSDFNASAAMADYLNKNVGQDILIETWEPEMGFLTNHNYHFPPQLLLKDAITYVWLNGTPPNQLYDFVQINQPDYNLVGQFARWVNLYPTELLSSHYDLESSFGVYELYAAKQ